LLEPGTTTGTANNEDSGTIGVPSLAEDQSTKPLTGADFVDWRDSLESRCLLVTAPPGSGKSVFSNFVTTHLEDHTSINKREKVIYYFCNIRVPLSERNAEAVIRALIIQLCQDQSGLLDLLSPRFEKDSNAFLQAPFNELWGILSFMMQKSSFSKIYYVIDGLDVYGKCMYELVRKLLSLFGILGPRTPGIKKLLCTSRPEPGIVGVWEGFRDRQLRPNGKDLRTYIESRIANLKKFNGPMRQAVKSALMKDFEDSLRVGQTGPTFLWISMAIKKLEQMPHPTIAKTESAIGNSSRDLDELFEELIVAAVDRAEENAVILAWVIYAEEPLSLEELQEAVAIEPSRDYSSYDELDDTRPMLTWSSVREQLGVLIDNIEGRLFVIHQSVDDFVKKAKPLNRWISPEPRLFLADCCMKYLLLCPVASQASPKRFDGTNVSPAYHHDSQTTLMIVTEW
jgi:hypothetical protein